MLKVTKNNRHYRVELFQVSKLNTLFSELVKQQLQVLVQEPGNKVIFNLEGIRFIDTAGFQVLIDISERARKNSCEFAICNVSDELKELIQLLELEGAFSFCSCEKSEEKILVVLD